MGRSQNKAMTDARVRKAFIMAIDRDALVKNLVPGGEKAVINTALCFPTTFGCAPTTSVYPYNPAEAKRLLAEAGYPNGFDLTLDAHQPVKNLAEAIAGEVRKVGIRASVEPLSIAAYVRKRGDGEFTAFTGFYPAGTHPDMSVVLDFFFGQNRDYWNDALINANYLAGEAEFDDAKRTALYAPVLDRINTEAYILPVSELPIVWAHNKDVVVKQNPLTGSLPVLGDYGWKK
jgi:peptide/nickel transport system substrate-binding protein